VDTKLRLTEPSFELQGTEIAQTQMESGPERAMSFYETYSLQDNFACLA